MTDSLGGSAAKVSSFHVGTICRGAQVPLSSVLSVAGNNDGRNRKVQQIGNLAPSLVSRILEGLIMGYSTDLMVIESTCLKGEKDLCARVHKSLGENSKLDCKAERGNTRLPRDKIDLQLDNILGTPVCCLRGGKG